MKLVLSLICVLALAACSSTSKTETAKESCGACAGTEKKDCGGDCAGKEGHKCDGACKTNHGGAEHHATALPVEAWPLDAAHVKGRISQEEFQAALTKNQEKLNKSCVAPAQKYCGKETKDMMVSQTEVVCLYTKVNRVTREKLPQLDGTPCANLIKGMTPKAKK